MATLPLAFCLIGLSLAGLAAGLFFGRPPVKGSCGGLAALDGTACAVCGREEGCGR
ncbi:MAG: (Na+)-NQR maturation NqrM [Rhizobiaceae bacterium]|nr:(Na+)-NQR maturation NqrM [Rhizobiaceae bacterium]